MTKHYNILFLLTLALLLFTHPAQQPEKVYVVEKINACAAMPFKGKFPQIAASMLVQR